ncbi:hypothetical protein HDU82_004981 [Entophlyctis luteolus]|nr:hypothetical protein HDU82_004981 [Entophlyctis luteolus]
MSEASDRSASSCSAYSSDDDGSIDIVASDALTGAFSSLRSALSTERPFKKKGTAIGVVDLKTLLTHVARPIGPMFASMGFSAHIHEKISPVFNASGCVLYPEEALFLSERGSLIIKTAETAECVQEVLRNFKVTNEYHQLLLSMHSQTIESHLETIHGVVGALSLEECYNLFLRAGEPTTARWLPNSGCQLEQYQAYAHLKRAGYIVFRHIPSQTASPPWPPIADFGFNFDMMSKMSFWFLFRDWMMPLAFVIFRSFGKRFHFRKG